MRRRVAVAFAVLLAATTAVPLASPTDHRPRVPIDYEVELLDRDGGWYRIEATFSNLDGNVPEITFQGDAYVLNYPNCRNLVVDGDPKDGCNGRFTVEPDSDTLTYRFDAILNRSATNDGYNAITTQDWAVLQADGIGFQFSYSFYEGQKPVFEPTLGFSLPDGWEAEASFPVRDDDRFALDPRFPRPAGIVVLGELETTDLRTVGRDAVLAEIAPSPDADVAELVKGTGSYLRSTHGDHLGEKPLFVVAPDPFKRGGIASRDGFIVHEDVDAQTVVHEWVHLWQRFEVCNRRQGQDCFPGDADRTDRSGATVWVKEGGAEFYSGLALFAAGEWGPSRVQRFFDGIEDDYEEGELDETVYGPGQDPAYTKGALVVARMDERIRDRSNATRDLGTVLSAMNRDAAEASGSLTVTNDIFQQRLEEITGGDWSTFFDDYVDGDDDHPGGYTFDPTGTFQLSDLAVAPDPVVAGASMTISANVTNTGTAAENRTFRFFVDGAVAGNATVDLEAGGSARINATTTAPPPGSVRVEVGTLSRLVDVLAPADLVPGVVQPDPVQPRAERPYAVTVGVANRGDLPEPARIRLDLDGGTIGNRSVTVGGDASATVRFGSITSPAGTVNATATLTWSGPTRTTEASWTVAERRVFEIPTTPGPALVAALLALGAVARAWSKR